MKTAYANDFESWREAARGLLAEEVPPESVHWEEPHQDDLFATAPVTSSDKPQQIVPRAFISAAKLASCYRDPKRWALLYRILWRLTHGENNLLHLLTDDDIRQLRVMEKAVARDKHKMKAFVRFRKIDETYIAWHQPSHFIVELTAPFFVRRFSTMQFALLTPDCCAYWDQHTLRFGDGLPREAAPEHDDLEALWKTFYRHIFNPARIKLSMMQSEMPKKFWHTLPETALIPSMLAEAPARVREMLAASQSISTDNDDDTSASDNR